MRGFRRLSLVLLCLLTAAPLAASIPDLVESPALLVGRVGAVPDVLDPSLRSSRDESPDARRLVHDALRVSFREVIDRPSPNAIPDDSFTAPTILAPWTDDLRFTLIVRRVPTENAPNRIPPTLWDLPDLYLVASTESRTKILTGFKAAPFVEPATGLAYFRARWYDPSTGTFLTPDPMGYQDSSNLYAFTAGDPVNNEDPRGEYIEIPLEAISLSIGVWSFNHNMEQGNWGSAAWDLFGIAVDTAGLVVPGTLAVGASTEAVRAGYALSRGQKLYLGAQAIQQTGDAGLGLLEAGREYRQGNYGWGTFYLGMSALGFHGAKQNAMEVFPVGGYGLARTGFVPGVRQKRLLYGDDILSEAINETSLYRAGLTAPPRHHIFPQEGIDFFEAHGFKGALHIDEFTVELTEGVHQGIHGGGNWRLGRKWTGEWNTRIMRNLRRAEKRVQKQFGRDLTFKEVFEEGLRMMKHYRIDDIPFVHFRPPR